MLAWLVRLGAVGLVALGILDASVVPLPGSLDLLLIILAAQKHELWPLYAAGAWIGAVAGGYLTFRIGQKGGKELLEKKIPKSQLGRVQRWMDNHSSLTLFIPTLMPPPTPVSYFILGAGAMGVKRKSYFLVFGSAKAIRYIALGWAAARYGHQIIGFAKNNYSYMLIGLLVLAVLAALAFGGWAIHRRRNGLPIFPRPQRGARRASEQTAA